MLDKINNVTTASNVFTQINNFSSMNIRCNHIIEYLIIVYFDKEQVFEDHKRLHFVIPVLVNQKTPRKLRGNSRFITFIFTKSDVSITYYVALI